MVDVEGREGRWGGGVSPGLMCHFHFSPGCCRAIPANGETSCSASSSEWTLIHSKKVTKSHRQPQHIPRQALFQPRNCSTVKQTPASSTSDTSTNSYVLKERTNPASAASTLNRETASAYPKLRSAVPEKQDGLIATLYSMKMRSRRESTATDAPTNRDVARSARDALKSKRILDRKVKEDKARKAEFVNNIHSVEEFPPLCAKRSLNKRSSTLSDKSHLLSDHPTNTGRHLFKSPSCSSTSSGVSKTNSSNSFTDDSGIVSKEYPARLSKNSMRDSQNSSLGPMSAQDSHSSLASRGSATHEYTYNKATVGQKIFGSSDDDVGVDPGRKHRALKLLSGFSGPTKSVFGDRSRKDDALARYDSPTRCAYAGTSKLTHVCYILVISKAYFRRVKIPEILQTVLISTIC
jgi:hypothetical protein